MAASPQAPQLPAPTVLQRFFASNWPLWIWFLSVQAGCIIALLRAAETPLHPRGLTIWLLAGVLFAILLGSLLALPLGSIVLPPIFAWRIRCNGGPFRPGDTVLIITGPHRGLVTTVYEPSQGIAVCIDLGGEAKRNFADDVSQLNLLRVPRTMELDDRGRGAE